MRSLNNLSDFSLDVSNGNYDNYGGITDSLLSAEANKDVKPDPNSPGGGVHHRGGGGQHHSQHQPQHGGGASSGGGVAPLLDFKSAFSDIDTKPSDLR